VLVHEPARLEETMATPSGLTTANTSSQNSSGLYAGSVPATDSLFSRPRVVNQTLGWMSNYRIEYHYTIKRWRNNLDKSIKNGQLAFLKNGPEEKLGKYRAYTAYNLQMVNYQLYRDAIDSLMVYQANLPAAGANDDTNREHDVEDLENALNSYRFMGVVINDVNGEYDTGNNRDRVVNVAVGGRESTFNVWGNIHDGDHLYLKLVKVEVKGTDFQLYHMSQKSQPESHTISAYQFVPCLSKQERWLPDAASKTDLHPSHCFYVGKVFRCPRGRNLGFSDATREQLSRCLNDSVTRTHMFEMHIQVNHS